MKTIQTRRCEMLGRVVEFGQKYGHLFPRSSEAGETFAAVAAAVEQLREHTMSRMSSERVGKGSRTLAREALHERLDAMVQVARTIGETTPGFEDRFELPADANDQELIAAGRLFAKNAEDAKKRFVAHACPTTFIVGLSALVDTFEEAVRERNAGQVDNTAAKATIEHAVESGLAAVRKLDAMVRFTLEDDPIAMEVWDKSRRVQYRNRVRAAAPAPVATTPSLGPSPAPVVATPATPAPAPAPDPAASTPAEAPDTAAKAVA